MIGASAFFVMMAGLVLRYARRRSLTPVSLVQVSKANRETELNEGIKGGSRHYSESLNSNDNINLETRNENRYRPPCLVFPVKTYWHRGCSGVAYKSRTNWQNARLRAMRQVTQLSNSMKGLPYCKYFLYLVLAPRINFVGWTSGSLSLWICVLKFYNFPLIQWTGCQ